MSLYRPRLPLFVNTGVGRALTTAKNAAFAASNGWEHSRKSSKKGFSQGQNGSKKHRPAGWLRREGHTRTAEGAYLIFCYLLPLLLLYAQHSFFDQY